MTLEVPGRAKWFILLAVAGLWFSVSIFVVMPLVPRPDLPAWTASSYVVWALFLYAVLSVALPYMKVIRPGALDRRLQARAQGELSKEELIERIVKVAVVFSLVPILAGYIAAFLTRSVSHYWLFVVVAALSAVAYWRRTGDMFRAISDEQNIEDTTSAG